MSSVFAWFHQQIAVLATMHRKEVVIAPLLRQALGLEVVVPEHLNTDRFGSFTREIPRAGSQLEAARLKAQAALELTGHSIAIASEGSFGPHPAFPALPSNRELVILIDREHDLEIVGQAVSIETNFRHAKVKSLDEAKQFANQVGFPAHGLMVMTYLDVNGLPTDRSTITKGITTEAQLIAVVTEALLQADSIHLETDMRAMHNPTRMQVIAQATQDLLHTLCRCCPSCGWPGFEEIEQQRGLPCGLCGLPTTQIQAIVYGCKKCQHRQETPLSDGRSTADPMYCAYCNP